MSRGFILFVAILVALVASVAQAKDLWTSEDGKSAFEAQGFYKSLGEYFVLPSGLVTGANALQPPGAAAVPRDVGLAANILRVWGRLVFKDEITLDAGWEVGATTATPVMLTGGLLSSGASAASMTTAVPGRRLVDFSPNLITESGFLVQHNLDLLSAKVRLPKGELVVGRQVLSWGTGRFWNPTDLLSPFSPTDFDKEIRHGVDAVRLSVPFSATSLLDVIWLAQQDAQYQSGVIRAQANVADYDFSASVAKYGSDVVIGADTAGDIGPLAVHAEAAYTIGIKGLRPVDPNADGARFLRAVAGLDWKPASGWMVTGEYYFNGLGAASASGYFAAQRNARVTTGEVFGAGKHYLGVAASWKTTELLTVNCSLIANLQDPSVIVFPVAEYSFEQHVLIRLGGYLPLGRQPDPRALTGVTPLDLAAYQNATASFLRSEYGASPAGVFVQVGAHF